MQENCAPTSIAPLGRPFRIEKCRLASPSITNRTLCAHHLIILHETSQHDCLPNLLLLIALPPFGVTYHVLDVTFGRVPNVCTARPRLDDIQAGTFVQVREEVSKSLYDSLVKWEGGRREVM